MLLVKLFNWLDYSFSTWVLWSPKVPLKYLLVLQKIWAFFFLFIIQPVFTGQIKKKMKMKTVTSN
jgi:hypothetical protein